MSDAERLEQLERRLAQLEEQMRVLAGGEAGRRGSGYASQPAASQSRATSVFPSSPRPRFHAFIPASPLPRFPRFHPSSGSANASSWP